MKVIFVPDIHNRILNLNHQLDKEGYDLVVFLGDYFDSFFDRSDPVNITRATCKWLSENIDNPQFIFHWGNHDLSYRYPCYRCSGWTNQKQSVINMNIDQHVWDSLRLFSVITLGDEKWWTSHGGIHSDVFSHPVEGVTEAHVQAMCDKAMQLAAIGKWHPALEPGLVRGGSAYVGGITWLDFNHEFEAINGINQIVGHTPQESNGVLEPTYFEEGNSKNWAIDTSSAHYLVWEDGKFTVVPTGRKVVW